MANRVLLSSKIRARDTSRAQIKDSETQRALVPLVNSTYEGPGAQREESNMVDTEVIKQQKSIVSKLWRP